MIKSPKLRFNDIGYIKHNGNVISLELYNAGTAVETIQVNHLVCVSKGCMTKSSFNKEYLSSCYPDDFIKNLLMRKPVFQKMGYRKTKNGFIQEIQTKKVSIIYKVIKENLYFKDRKNKILVKLKEINE